MADPGAIRLVFHVLAVPDGSGLVPGMVMHTEGEAVVVGRGDGVDLRLLDPTVSRRHARLAVAGEALVIERLNAHNGLFVDGAEVADRLTVPRRAMEVQLGGVLVRVQRPAVSVDRTTRQVAERVGAGAIEARWQVMWDAQFCTVQLDGRGLELSPLVAAFLGALLESPDAPIHRWDLLERLGPRTNLNQCATLARRAIRRRLDAGELSAHDLLASIRAADDVAVDPEDPADVMKKLLASQHSYGFVARVGQMGVQVTHR